MLLVVDSFERERRTGVGGGRSRRDADEPFHVLASQLFVALPASKLHHVFDPRESRSGGTSNADVAVVACQLAQNADVLGVIRNVWHRSRAYGRVK